MITLRYGLLLAVVGELAGTDVIAVTAAVDFTGEVTGGAAGAIGVALARTDITDFAGISDGRFITRPCDSVIVSAAAGLIAAGCVWVTGVTLDTD